MITGRRGAPRRSWAPLSAPTIWCTGGTSETSKRVKPQCQQNLGVGRIAPGHSFARLDRRLEAAQIHRLQHPPDRTRWMIARQPRIEIDRLQVQLLTISFSQPHHFLHHPTSTSTIIPLAPQNAIPKYKKITNSERSRRAAPTAGVRVLIQRASA